MSSTDDATSRWRTAVLVVAPAVLLAAFLAHPYLAGRLPNDAAVATAVAAGTTIWGLVHLATNVASGLVVLAFLAVRGYLREAGEERFSAFGVPFVVLGSVLFAVLPGMEFAPLAAARTGATTAAIAAAQAALAPWFLPVLLTAAVIFAIGAFSFAWGISATTVAGPVLSRVVAVALVVMALSRFVPLAAVQFYVQGGAAVAAFWLLAAAMRTQPRTHSATRGQPIPTSS